MTSNGVTCAWGLGVHCSVISRPPPSSRTVPNLLVPYPTVGTGAEICSQRHMPKTNSGRSGGNGRYGTRGGKAAKRTPRLSPAPPARLTHHMHDPACCVPSPRVLRPRTHNALIVHLRTLAGELHKDSLAADYGKFVEELQRVLALKWRGVFKNFPRVVCWVDVAQKDKYEVWYEGSLRTNETTTEDWARDPIGQCDYSVALMFHGTFGHLSAAAHTPASMGNRFWCGTKLWKGDWWSAGEVGTRLSPGLSRGCEARQYDSRTLGKQADSGTEYRRRCVELMLDWLQTLVEDGIDWDEFEMANTR
ncbi:hypothetical protein B0H13DRAFT_1859015 [Mycena leptocephala]|nr:hypothetical protein B0H13DRAFT_1859015 [Mycena leptocephala]